MKVLMINGSARRKGNTFLALSEIVQIGAKPMRTLADNMAFLLKKIHVDGQPQYPDREEWQPMHFIR